MFDLTIAQDTTNRSEEAFLLDLSTEAAEPRFYAILNQTNWQYGQCDFEYKGHDGYAGFDMFDLMFIETGRFEFKLVETGHGRSKVRVGLRPHLIEDGEKLNLATDWLDMVPVVKWFLDIEGEDIIDQRDW